MRSLSGLLATTFLALNACGPKNQTAQDPGISGDPTGSSNLCPPARNPDGSANYPDGPYGANVGDVVKNIGLLGYRGAVATSPYETICFSDFWDPTGTKGTKLLLVDVSAVWCSACKLENQTLDSRCAARKAEGLACYEALFEDSNYNPAKQADLLYWGNFYGLHFPLTVDPDLKFGIYFDQSAAPLNMFVDLRTMKILEMQLGYSETAQTQSINKYLAQIQ